MEAELVEAASEVFDPNIDHTLVGQDKLHWARVCPCEDEADPSGGW